MCIRKMNIDDYEEVYALWLSCKGMGLNNLDDSYEGINKFIQYNPETTLVYIKDDHIVGVIMIGVDGRRGYIYHTAVSPDYRHQGIATKLVHTALDQLESMGINKVALVVFARNETGNAFWEKLGFKPRTDITYRDHVITEMVRYDS